MSSWSMETERDVLKWIQIFICINIQEEIGRHEEVSLNLFKEVQQLHYLENIKETNCCAYLWIQLLSVWRLPVKFQLIKPEKLDRKWDVSLTVHFLYQCHMISPQPRSFRRLEAVFSPFILMGDIVITDYDRIVTETCIGSIFSRGKHPPTTPT